MIGRARCVLGAALAPLILLACSAPEHPQPHPHAHPAPRRAGDPGGRATETANVPCGTALSSLRPGAGTTLALSRNCTYRGTLTIVADDVTVTAWGTGSLPVLLLGSDGATVDLYGSHDTVGNLSLVGVAPRTWDCGGTRTPAGHVDGVDIHPGATGDTVTGITATGFYAAVYIMAGASGNTVRDSTLRDNTELDRNGASGSAGAFGVLLWGNGNKVMGNDITGNQACSLAYGTDGSAVEVYGGSGNVIVSNRASGDSAFTELGSYRGHVASGNSYTGNSVSDGATELGMTFLITRGSGGPYGPVYDTTATGNTVHLTNPGDRGVISAGWRPGDGTLLTLARNYLDLGTRPVLYEDGGYVDGAGNTFIGTCTPPSAC